MLIIIVIGIYLNIFSLRMKDTHLIDAILKFAAAAFNAYSVAFFEKTEEGSAKCRLSSWHSKESRIDPDAVIVPGKGLAGWILRHKMPLVLNAFDGNRSYLSYYRQDNAPVICSFMGCPVSEKGILCVDSLVKNAFPPEKQRLLPAFAELLEQHGRLVLPALDRTDYLEALDGLKTLRLPFRGWRSYLAQFIRQVLQASHFEYAAFASKLAEDETYLIEYESPVLLKSLKSKEFSIYSDIIGWVFRNNQAVFQQETSVSLYSGTEYEAEFASYACIPVTIQNQICGVLLLASKQFCAISTDKKRFLLLASDDLSRTLEWLSYQQRTKKNSNAIR